MGKVHLEIMNESRTMQFEKEEDCRQIYQMFGGPQQLAERFPLFSQAMDRARQQSVPEEENTGFSNWITIYSVLYDPEKKELEINFNITLKQTCSLLFAYVYDSSGSMFESLFFENTQMTNTTTTFQNVELSVGDTFRLYVESPFISGNETVLRGIKNFVDAAYTADDVIKEITVYDPALKENTQPPIKVSYGRTLGRGEVVDYSFMESRTPSGDQRFFLNVDGKIDLNEGYTIADITKMAACVMTGGEHGTIEYKNLDSIVLTPHDNKKGFSYHFDYDWKNEICNSVQYGNRLYIFDLSLIFKCIETGSQSFRAHVTSFTNFSSPSEVLIPKICLYWGCLAKNTLILMADGSEKEICRLTQGELIAAPDGPVRIRDIIRGTEETLWRLHLEGDLTVDASIMHPFLSGSGFIPVRNVVPSTKIITKNGPAAVKFCYTVDYGDEVYGLELEEGECFYANGIVTGSNQVQGRMLSVPRYPESEHCHAIRKEFSKMVSFVKERGTGNGASISDRY